MDDKPPGTARKVCTRLDPEDPKTENSGENGGPERQADSNVVPFPRDWFGPREELVPFGMGVSSDGEAAEPDVTAPSASDFWGEGSAAIHTAVQGPGVDETSSSKRRPPRRVRERALRRARGAMPPRRFSVRPAVRSAGRSVGRRRAGLVGVAAFSLVVVGGLIAELMGRVLLPGPFVEAVIAMGNASMWMAFRAIVLVPLAGGAVAGARWLTHEGRRSGAWSS